MASKKAKKKRKQGYARDPLEIIIRKKAKEFVSAEREYWQQRNALRENMRESIDALSMKAGEALPADVSSP